MKVSMFIDFTHCDPKSPQYRAVHPFSYTNKEEHALDFRWRFTWIASHGERTKAVNEIVLNSSGSEVFDNPTVQDYINERLETIELDALLIYVFGNLDKPEHIAKFNELVADVKLLKAKVIMEETTND